MMIYFLERQQNPSSTSIIFSSDKYLTSYCPQSVISFSDLERLWIKAFGRLDAAKFSKACADAGVTGKKDVTYVESETVFLSGCIALGLISKANQRYESFGKMFQCIRHYKFISTIYNSLSTPSASPIIPEPTKKVEHEGDDGSVATKNTNDAFFNSTYEAKPDDHSEDVASPLMQTRLEEASASSDQAVAPVDEEAHDEPARWEVKSDLDEPHVSQMNPKDLQEPTREMTTDAKPVKKVTDSKESASLLDKSKTKSRRCCGCCCC